MRLTVAAPQSTPLAQLMDDYLQGKRAKGVSRKTISIYRDALEGVLLPFAAGRGITGVDGLTDRLLADINAGLLDGTASRSGRALAKDTVHSYARAVNGFLAWAHKDGQQVTGKAALPTLRHRALDTLSREEIQAMEDAAATERDKLIVRVLGDTGLRLNELLQLTAADLKQDGRTCYAIVHGKGDKDRQVPMKPELYRRLKRFAEKGRRDLDTDRVFIALRRSPRTGEYEPLTQSGVQQLMPRLAEVAGIHRRVYPHFLRHSFATNYLRKGGSPLNLQKILGHESLATITRTYSHLTFGDAHAEAMRILADD